MMADINDVERIATESTASNNSAGAIDEKGGSKAHIHAEEEYHWYDNAKVQIAFFVILGVVAMVIHHVVYHRLDGTRVNTKTYAGLDVSVQAMIGAAGNAIASLACFAWGSAIGIVFVHVLIVIFLEEEKEYHGCVYPDEHVEAVLECQSSPLTPGAWKAWRANWKLPVIALIGAAMTFVTIFAPGSLRTATIDNGFAGPCTIPMFNISSGSIGTMVDSTWTPSPAVKKMTLQNLFVGQFIPPTSPCGSCSYDVTFNGPGMNCSNFTDSFPFSDMAAASTSTYVIIWNGTHTLASGGNAITAGTAEGYQLNYEAAACAVYNTTYVAHVQHNDSITSVNVNSSQFNDPITSDYISSSTPGALGMYTVALALAQHLYGYAEINVDRMIAVSLQNNNNHNMFYSALGEAGPDGSKTWLWEPSIIDSLPELMKNVSISLLSNPFEGETLPTEAQCLYSTVIYDYNATQLFLAYGIALIFTLACGLIGIWAIHKHGSRENYSIWKALLILTSRDGPVQARSVRREGQPPVEP